MSAIPNLPNIFCNYASYVFGNNDREKLMDLCGTALKECLSPDRKESEYLSQFFRDNVGGMSVKMITIENDTKKTTILPTISKIDAPDDEKNVVLESLHQFVNNASQEKALLKIMHQGRAAVIDIWLKDRTLIKYNNTHYNVPTGKSEISFKLIKKNNIIQAIFHCDKKSSTLFNNDRTMSVETTPDSKISFSVHIDIAPSNNNEPATCTVSDATCDISTIRLLNPADSYGYFPSYQDIGKNISACMLSVTNYVQACSNKHPLKINSILILIGIGLIVTGIILSPTPAIIGVFIGIALIATYEIIQFYIKKKKQEQQFAEKLFNLDPNFDKNQKKTIIDLFKDIPLAEKEELSTHIVSIAEAPIVRDMKDKLRLITDTFNGFKDMTKEQQTNFINIVDQLKQADNTLLKEDAIRTLYNHLRSQNKEEDPIAIVNGLSEYGLLI